MVPSPLHCHIQQLANMLRNKSMSLKLENIIVFTMYLSAILRHDASSTHACVIAGCISGQSWEYHNLSGWCWEYDALSVCWEYDTLSACCNCSCCCCYRCQIRRCRHCRLCRCHPCLNLFLQLLVHCNLGLPTESMILSEGNESIILSPTALRWVSYSQDITLRVAVWL